MKKAIPLTDRDRRILLLLGEYGCVTADRIKAQFWNDNRRSRAHYRRLGILKRQQLVENVEADGGSTNGYRLTKKGQMLFSDLFRDRLVPPNRRGYKTQFEHDQLLIDLRQIFLESPLIKDFKTESEVRRELLGGQPLLQHWEKRPLVPDATFVLEVPGNKMRVAVELELTGKTRQRYTRIFRHHLLSKNWQLVIYIVKDAQFKARLMRLLDEIRQTDIQVRIEKSLNGIYFCSLGEFQKMKLSVPMTNGKKEISLDQIAKNFGMKVASA